MSFLKEKERGRRKGKRKREWKGEGKEKKETSQLNWKTNEKTCWSTLSSSGSQWQNQDET